jgi:SAM-dependent methyltransferase
VSAEITHWTDTEETGEQPGGGQVKSQTDLYWSQRATSVEGDVEVNIMDIFQRDLEYDHVCTYLEKEMKVLEVGCGNGFSTNRFRGLVKHIDAFDSSEEMIRRARATYGESNNQFIHDSVLAPRHVSTSYDVVLCVRVLINLRDLTEQRLAIRNLVPLMRVGGRFILVEGFSDGFSSLNELRSRVALPPLEPAAINFYSSVKEVVADLRRELLTEAEFHLGAYDYLTRVVYPLMAGPQGVKHNTVFSEKCAALARANNPDCFKELSRVRGFVFKRVA